MIATIPDDLAYLLTSDVLATVAAQRSDGAAALHTGMDGLAQVVQPAFVILGVARFRAEEELKRTTAEMTRSNKELEQFAYVASHDLQEPLRMVASATQLLARDFKDQLNGDARSYIGFAVEGAKRMQELINALLKFSRVGVDRKPFELVDCQEVLANAVANLKIALEESDVELTHGLLPTVKGDAIQLTHLYRDQCAMNALHCLPHDTARLTNCGQVGLRRRARELNDHIHGSRCWKPLQVHA